MVILEHFNSWFGNSWPTADENPRRIYSELNFEERAEILRSIKYVSEVIPSDWLVTEEFLDLNRIDYIVHGDDHQNPISENRVILFPRTKGISSIELRERVLQNIQAKSL